MRVCLAGLASSGRVWKAWRSGRIRTLGQVRRRGRKRIFAGGSSWEVTGHSTPRLDEDGSTRSCERQKRRNNYRFGYCGFVLAIAQGLQSIEVVTNLFLNFVAIFLALTTWNVHLMSSMDIVGIASPA